jgi:hypothetical protein
MPRPKKKPPAPSPATPPDAAIANLETAGDRLKIYSLQNLLTNKRNPETRDAARLGDVLLPWFEKSVNRPADKLDGIAEAWQKLVPTALVDRSRLLGLHRGTLTVALDSAPVRAQLDGLLRGGLLRQLQTESRGALYRIKTCVQGDLPRQ